MSRIHPTALVDSAAQLDSTVTVGPYSVIGPNVRIERSIVGPHVSLGDGTVLSDVHIKNAIVGQKTNLSQVHLSGAMIGSSATYSGRSKDLSLGDFSSVHE